MTPVGNAHHSSREGQDVEWGDAHKAFLVFGLTLFLIAWMAGQACSQLVK